MICLHQGDVLLNLQLSGSDNKIHAIIDANGKVAGEEVVGKLGSVGPGNMNGDDAADGCGHSNWP